MAGDSAGGTISASVAHDVQGLAFEVHGCVHANDAIHINMMDDVKEL